jgi:hypothetical protein
MSKIFAFLILLAQPLLAQEHPPQILEIYRDPLRSGSEARYGKIGEEAARICVELQCPHPYLALESLRGPKEVWFLNMFESEAEKQAVSDGYAKKPTLTTAFKDIVAAKKGLIGAATNIFTTYQPALSDGKWRLSGARFFAVAITNMAMRGAVFQAPDGTRYSFTPCRTREEAVRIGGLLFAVRPSWSLPAQAWIAADPEFWKVSPQAKH